MLAILIALALLASPDCERGTLSQYAERPTLSVIANRSVPHRTAWTLPDDWRKYDGLIAVESCADLGKVYRVYWRGYRARMLAFDCSGHVSTSAWMRRNRIIAEVDYFTAKRWRSIGRGMRDAVMCAEK